MNVVVERIALATGETMRKGGKTSVNVKVKLREKVGERKQGAQTSLPQKFALNWRNRGSTKRDVM
jgi:hypothetical protein